jgi:hypothetical protein
MKPYFSELAWCSTLSLMLFSGLILTGCDSQGSDEEAGVRTTLQFEARYDPVAAKTNGNLVVEEALLLLKSIKFTEEDDDEEEEFRTGSFVVNLDLTGQANPVVVSEVPAGTYKRVTFQIHKPEDHEIPPDPAFREGSSGQQRYSVIVRGQVDGQPFTLKVRESIQQRIDLFPPLVVSDSTAVVVTLQADLNRWFVDEDGQPLDPRVEDDADEIADAIKDSFRALGTDHHGDDADDDADNRGPGSSSGQGSN